MAYRLKNLRVLVIDDNQPIRNLVRSLLIDLGFSMVDVAETMAEGWEQYIGNEPDIILVDWRMDKNDALDFVRRVRTSLNSPSKDVPIIMMTSYPNKDRLFQARDAGVTEFLIKPFTVETLTAHFTHLIEKPRDFVISRKFVGPDRRRRNNPVDNEIRIRNPDGSLSSVRQSN